MIHEGRPRSDGLFVATRWEVAQICICVDVLAPPPDVKGCNAKVKVDDEHGDIFRLSIPFAMGSIRSLIVAEVNAVTILKKWLQRRAEIR